MTSRMHLKMAEAYRNGGHTRKGITSRVVVVVAEQAAAAATSRTSPVNYGYSLVNINSQGRHVALHTHTSAIAGINQLGLIATALYAKINTHILGAKVHLL
jgi:hypothetical protein